jgi:hypothetical protein
MHTLEGTLILRLRPQLGLTFRYLDVSFYIYNLMRPGGLIGGMLSVVPRCFGVWYVGICAGFGNRLQENMWSAYTRAKDMM